MSTSLQAPPGPTCDISLKGSYSFPELSSLLDTVNTVYAASDPGSFTHTALSNFLLPTIRSAQEALEGSSCRITFDLQTTTIFYKLVEGYAFKPVSDPYRKGLYGSATDVKIGDLDFVYKRPRPSSDREEATFMEEVHREERRMLWRLQSRHIIPVFGVDNTGGILLPHIIELSACIDEIATHSIIAQGLECLDHLNRQHVRHDDVTLDTFGLYKNTLIIADLTAARNESAPPNAQPSFPVPGMVLSRDESIWSFGVTCLELLIGGMSEVEKTAFIFPTADIADVHFEISELFNSHAEALKERDPKGAVQEIVKTMLIALPKKRPSPQKIQALFTDVLYPSLPIRLLSIPYINRICAIHSALYPIIGSKSSGETLAKVMRTVAREHSLQDTSPLYHAVGSFLLPTLSSAYDALISDPNKPITLRETTIRTFNALIQGDGQVHELYPLFVGRANSVTRQKAGSIPLAAKQLLEKPTPFDRFLHINEQRMLWRMNSSYILSITGVYGKVNATALFPLADTDLSGYYTSLTPQSLQKMVRDTLQGVAYMHENTVVHRDIKPGNILVYGDSFVIADFEIACTFEQEGDASCTYLYAAPEVLFAIKQETHQYTPNEGKVDIWSLGVTFIRAITQGEARFITSDEVECFKSVEKLTELFIEDRLQEIFTTHQATIETLDPDGIVKSLITKMLAFSPSERPDADALLKELPSLT